MRRVTETWCSLFVLKEIFMPSRLFTTLTQGSFLEERKEPTKTTRHAVRLIGRKTSLAIIEVTPESVVRSTGRKGEELATLPKTSSIIKSIWACWINWIIKNVNNQDFLTIIVTPSINVWPYNNILYTHVRNTTFLQMS